MNERFHFQCPSTGRQTDGFCEKVDGPAESRHWTTIQCHACGSVHVVDSRSGHVVAASNEVPHAPHADQHAGARIA